MSERIEHIDELIGKFLSGESTAQEQLQVENWLNESEEHRQYFNQLKIIFEKTSAVKSLETFDTDAAWEKLKARMHEKQSPKIRAINTRAQWWRVAASLVLILGIGFFLYQYLNAPQRVNAASQNAILKDTLPDGTHVLLNKQSTLAFEYNPKNKSRTVKLQGEAYFDIHHDKSKPFVIETENVFVRDIGTAFNLQSYPERNTVEVWVDSGEVIFYSSSDSGIHVYAGEHGVYDKLLKRFSKAVEGDPNILAYKTRLFVFNNTDLKTVVETLNSVYEKPIHLSNDSIGNCKITVRFKDETIETIANILAETLNLTVTSNRNEILLDGQGCAQ